jgi:TPP-dependent pyruvate/acetoin dehydrogenase alpha subunit
MSDSTIDRGRLLHAYRQMKLIREFEERLHVEIATGDIPGFTHLVRRPGGRCRRRVRAIERRGLHRQHPSRPRPLHRQGLRRAGMMKEIYGRQDGLCHGKGGSMHIADMTKGMLGANAIVGGGPPIAVGAAIACKLRGNRNVSVAFGGDGSANQGTVFEAMNMAVVLKVPAIFILENNGYSEHTGAAYAVGSKRSGGPLRGLRHAGGVRRRRRFHAVFDAMGRAVARAKNGEGPSTIETTITRFYGHFEGDPQNYRAKDEVAKLRVTMDCLKRFRARVEADRSVAIADLDRIDAEVSALIERAVVDAKASPPRRPRICTPTSTSTTNSNKADHAATQHARCAQPGPAPGDGPRRARHRSRRGCFRRRRRHVRRTRGLGRNLRRHQGIVAEIRRRPRPRHAHFRVGHHRCRRGGGARGPAPGRRAHVRRLRRRVHGSDLQPDRQVPLHVRRQEHMPGGDSHGHGRRHEYGAAALADHLLLADRDSRTENRHSLERLRCQGPVDPGDPR